MQVICAVESVEIVRNKRTRTHDEVHYTVAKEHACDGAVRVGGQRPWAVEHVPAYRYKYNDLEHNLDDQSVTDGV